MHRFGQLALLAPLTLSALLAVATARADWPTHRGNAARTGNPDGQPGPKDGKVLWVHDAKEHFVAAPVADGKSLFVSGLGAFNSAIVEALSLDGSAKKAVWLKGPPFLKLPVVSAPAIVDGKIVFGDGMHQTDGASLFCLSAVTGRPAWRLTVPGELVHIEGSPAIANGRVYVGGGHAGVLCVDLNKVELDGKDLTLAAAEAEIEKKWKDLQARYEADKAKDPDFAVPPSDDQLPKPAPKLVWQQGKNKWHVDAALLFDSELVYVASAYLDKEKTGERALIALSAKDGSEKWKAPLKQNPWSGPTLAGDAIVVAGSTIRFDPQEVSKGRGDLTAITAATGAIKWTREVPGGIVSSVAYKDNLVFCTATDGKIRAYSAATGLPRWNFTAKAPFFAGPAVAGNIVYAADLAGIIYAVGLADGKLIWSIDLASDPLVRAPGMVYGSPIVHGGKLYVATCNLEGVGQQRKTAVVCIGDQK